MSQDPPADSLSYRYGLTEIKAPNKANKFGDYTFYKAPENSLVRRNFSARDDHNFGHWRDNNNIIMLMGILPILSNLSYYS